MPVPVTKGDMRGWPNRDWIIHQPRHLVHHLPPRLTVDERLPDVADEVGRDSEVDGEA